VFTDAVQGIRHQDSETTDGYGSTAITIITTARKLVLADVLHPYVAPECGHHIDNLNSSDNLNFNDPTTALMSMYPPTDASLTPPALSLSLVALPTLDDREYCQHLENLNEHLPTAQLFTYQQTEYSNPQSVLHQPYHSQITYYFDTISVTSSIWITQTSNKPSMTRTIH